MTSWGGRSPSEKTTLSTSGQSTKYTCTASISNQDGLNCSSDVLSALQSFEVDEIKSAVAMAIIPPHIHAHTILPAPNVVAAFCSDDNTQTCNCCPSPSSCHRTEIPLQTSRESWKSLELPSISEEVPTLPYKDRLNQVELEKKLSNASVHKKKRGIARRLSQRQRESMQQQDLRGLTRVKFFNRLILSPCRMIQAQIEIFVTNPIFYSSIKRFHLFL